MNAERQDYPFMLPAGNWQGLLDTTHPHGQTTWHGLGNTPYPLAAHSLVLLAASPTATTET